MEVELIEKIRAVSLQYARLVFEVAEILEYGSEGAKPDGAPLDVATVQTAINVVSGAKVQLGG